MQDIFLGQDGTFIFESTKKEFELVQGLDTRFKNKDINVYFSTDWLFYCATLSYAKL